MRKWPLSCLVVLLVTCQGCIVIPASNERASAGTKIGETRLQFIRLGATTRAAVIQQLGSPDADFADLRVMAYSWEMPVAVVLWVMPGGYTGGQGVGKHCDLLIEVDERDQVSRFEITKRGLHDTTRSTAVAWAVAHGNCAALALPTQFTAMPVPSGKSLIYIYRPGGFEVPYGAVAVGLNNRTLADLRSKEYISVIVEPGSHAVWLRAHTLLSGTGSLSVEATERSFAVDTLANEAIYLRVTVPAGHGRLDPHLKVVQETEAMTSLSKLKPW